MPQAKFLDIIVYSREQLTKEYDAMPDAKGDPALLPRAPWGIISVKAQVMKYITRFVRVFSKNESIRIH